MKRFLLILALLSLPIFIWLFWQYSQEPQTLSSTLKSFDRAGEETKKDLSRIPSLPVTEDENSFIMQDDNQTGLSITYANQKEENQLSSEEEAKDLLSLSFPKDQTKPIEIKLDKERVITIQDLKNQNGFSFQKITDDAIENESFFRKLFKTNQEEIQPTYLTATNQRKTLLYTLEKDHATNEKKLKSWTLYEKGNGIEEEAYRFTNAKIKINDDGNAEVFYFGEKEIQNQQTQADVEPSLLERAQRVISQDIGEDILNSNKNPDFLIPKPFFYDKNGDIHETDWKYDEETNTLSLQISTKDDLYPIALDPTLAFTAPAQSNTGWVIEGEAKNNYLGYSLVSGDFNADGKTDLAVGAYGYSTNTGRAYIFYNDGSIPTTAATADVIITGETTSNYFGTSLASGDFNADGKTDLSIGARGYSTSTGRAYIFYNDGSIPTTAATADVIITGEASSYFGYSMTSGDFNADGRTDLAVGAYGYSTSTGRAYLFYNDGSIPTTAATADVIITGETTNNSFGYSLTSGDWNADGRTDLAVGAYQYSTNTGRTYLFYSGSIITENASGADIIITGEASSLLGSSLASGDFNADGRTDLAVGAYGYSSSTGRVYLFYNGSIITENASGADVIITGETTSNLFGTSLTSGDFNADGKTDLAIGAYGYSTNDGRVYLFYNDGSIPTTAVTADVIIAGEINSGFGASLTSGDFNADGKTDLAVGVYFYASSRGRVYIFTSQNGQVNTNISLTGETTSNNFGRSLTSGDFNADGRTDLIVGADTYSTNTGRAYLFYNDGSLPTTAATADVIITGEATGNYFGRYLSAGDVNADGKTDVLIGAGSATKAYVFYNDGSYPSLAANSDVVINGISVSNISIGDLNTDGKQDILIAHFGYGSNGRAYLFYADGTNNFGSAACTGSVPTSCTGSNADIIVDGTGGKRLGAAVAGDANADGRSDMLLGGTNNTAGELYVLYNDGTSFGTAACTTACSVTNADVTISGENTGDNFASSIVVGDMNNDGRADIVTVAQSYSSNTGRVYFFYNDGSYPAAAGNADSIMTGEGTASYPFGDGLNVADMNADGRVDLVVGAYGYGGGYGRAYIVYNDEAYPSGLVNADIVIIGEISSGYFGSSLTPGDFNADGKIDLIVGAHNYSSGTGRVYLYETRDNFVWQLQPQSSLSGSLRTNPSFSGQELKIAGEVGAGKFGSALASGDFNADGKIDLIVGAPEYSTNTGRAYIFYSDGHLAAAATNADVIITGETTNNYFGASLTAGDFNADGRTDLAIGATGYSSSIGRAYIFYNDGSIPTTTATADVIITGEAASDNFGCFLVSGDFNSDGKNDLSIGAFGYSSSTGRAYLFYNDGSIPTTAATADVIITGGATANYFGSNLVSGDFNADGKTDLTVGAWFYSSGAGRAYIFYNDGSIPTTAATADVIITGESTSYFGNALTAGDLNGDGKIDLAVGGWGYSTSTGRTYIFYNDGSIPTTAATADVIITGESTNTAFGYALVIGDFNADGKTDLAVGAPSYTTATGRTYLFYNDGSIPTTAATADVIITGETTSNSFGSYLVSGDFNADGKIDLAVGATGYASSRGRAYMYTFNDGVITGGATFNYFGYSIASGDFNADGKTDLAVGAYGYSTSTGRAYIFYNDGSLPTTAATADIIITGEASSSFGILLTPGDFNADGKTDLSVGAESYSSGTGRAYLFYNGSIITENASGADVIITGEASSFFGFSLASGDFNADGKIDLVVGARVYSTNTGRAYLFYNGSIITENASGADVIITGETTGNYFGYSLTSGDFNADGKTDLAVGAYTYSSNTGRAYLFYNGSIITENASGADILITGETTSNFAVSLASGDFNADGKTDLAVGADSYSSPIGRVYLFYNGSIITENASGADVKITGEASSLLGSSLASGDFNADGKTDLAVGAVYVSSNTGRVYLFYNDGSLPTTAATADVIITGEATGNLFGYSLASGDFNADGKTDLAVGAYVYSTSTGRVYIFITEAKTEESLQQWKSKGTLRAKGNFQVK